MEVVELAPGVPMSRARAPAESEEEDEEDYHQPTAAEQLREDPGVIELETSEERQERQTLTTRVLRYTAAFPNETSSFKLSRKKLERRSLSELKQVENDVSHAVATRRTASARRTPLMSNGTETFSAAVSEGSRLKDWKTKPTRSPR